MVEHGSINSTYNISPNNSSTQVLSNAPSTNVQNRVNFHVQSGKGTPPPPAPSTFDPHSPISASPVYHAGKPMTNTLNLRRSSLSSIRSKVRSGVLSTSPDVGRDLMTMITSPHLNGNVREQSFANGFNRIITMRTSDLLSKSDFSLVVTMLAIAEDVGRRAVNVAQIGDSCSFLAMRLSAKNMEVFDVLGGSRASMDGFGGGNPASDPFSLRLKSDKKELFSTEMSTEGININNERTSEKAVNNPVATEDDEDDEMPFAVTVSETEYPEISLRSKNSFNTTNVTGFFNGKSEVSSSQCLGHFREALSCYLKALTLMKGAVHAVQLLKDKVEGNANANKDRNSTKVLLANRCDTSLQWLSNQFTGVLERADACNVEINKMSSTTEASNIVGVEELIYNHALVCGRDGAVKQLLSQYDAAKACYRSAGILIEVLLMESRVGEDDRKILNGYVDDFLARVKELDALMSNRVSGGSAVVGIVGGVVANQNQVY